MKKQNKIAIAIVVSLVSFIFLIFLTMIVFYGAGNNYTMPMRGWFYSERIFWSVMPIMFLIWLIIIIAVVLFILWLFGQLQKGAEK